MPYGQPILGLMTEERPLPRKDNAQTVDIQTPGTETSEEGTREAFGPMGASRRGLRDLAALMALPAMWVDHAPTEIVSGLLGVLFAVLRLDYAFVRFDDPSDGPPLERARPEGHRLPSEFESVVRASEQRGREAFTANVADPSGDGTLRMTMMTPGLPGENGVIIVGARRDDFPTSFELYLLRVAAGQAAISIHSARRLSAERAARIAAETALSLRNDLLETIARDLSGPLVSLIETAERARILSKEPRRPADSASFSESAPKDARPKTAALPMLQMRLTRRETEVLGLLAQGLSNKEIAGLMWLSDRTVERHITGLYRKIGVERRSEATAFAMLHGLVEAQTPQA